MTTVASATVRAVKRKLLPTRAALVLVSVKFLVKFLFFIKTSHFSDPSCCESCETAFRREK